VERNGTRGKQRVDNEKRENHVDRGGEVDGGHMAARERRKGGLHEGRRAHSWLNTGQMRKAGLHERR
jgi:hypothetical protein